MKILVLSDSHGDLSVMNLAIHQEAPDCVIHLGDHVWDAEALREKFPGLTIYSVPGNCDGHTDLADTVMITKEGVRILFTHGHRQNVKFGLMRLALEGEEKGADVVLFGHTHARLCTTHGRMWMLNPGSCHRAKSWGILEVRNGQVSCRLNGEEA